MKDDIERELCSMCHTYQWKLLEKLLAAGSRVLVDQTGH